MSCMFLAGAALIITSDPEEFVSKTDARRFETLFRAIGIGIGILGGFLFAITGFVDEMFDDNKNRG